MFEIQDLPAAATADRANTPQPDALDLAELELESDLHQALDRGQIEIFYQPLVALADGRLTGFVAELAWNHPQRGVLAADAFVALAEELGLGSALGDWLLHRACGQLAAWRRSTPGQPPLELHIRLLPAQLVLPRLDERIGAILRAAELEPTALHLDVPEELMATHLGAASGSIHGLRSRYVKIQLAEFGSGFSSLGYLRRLPIDALKLDRYFNDHLDAKSLEIVRAVIGLAHRLGLEVISDGVTDADQRDLLLALGCDYALGELFGGPLRKAEAEEFLSAERSQDSPAL